MLQTLADKNGFGDRIQIVHSVLQDVSAEAIPAQSIDIIISETLSTMVFNEKGIETLIEARDRWLKPEGLLFPSTVPTCTLSFPSIGLDYITSKS